jgi:hypothetical protein
MPTIVRCPHCQCQLKLPDEYFGRQVRCPSCKAEFQAALPAPPAPIPPPGPPVPNISTTPYPTPNQGYPPPNQGYPPPYQQPDRGYDPPGGYYDEPRPRRRREPKPHRGGVILTLGLLAFFLSWFPLVGWILAGFCISMAQSDLPSLRNGRMDEGGLGMTQTGQVFGIIGAVINTIIIIVLSNMN